MRLTDRIFGGIKMSWGKVIALAVGCALLTTVFLLFPVFKGTSFERMGVYLEAWFLPAVLIMANTDSPKDSALKVFVFFLISQPLIYLFQVPFTELGWGIFRYYGYWFLWTLATLPLAYFGWHIRRRDWWSVLIFAPVLAFLGYTAADCALTCSREFPRLLIAALFCIAQILLYVCAFFPKGLQKLAGIAFPVTAAVVFLLLTPSLDLTVSRQLPEGHVYSSEAVLKSDDSEAVNIQLAGEKTVYIHVSEYGTYGFTVEDNGKTDRYQLEVYRREDGYPEIAITYLGEK
ncbi:MAG: hypothetical protein IKR06_04625 [Erysipelotrichaceae bacterium]|nr:hypothetical protein [Erysipelotrichaceae bacterium]MBR4122558.1 hypothetical protein [Erysipelotrichaceae bacterium]